MTTNSKQAYFNPANEKSRISHKKQCLAALEREPDGLTFFEVARKTGLTDQQTWKRLSDLEKEGTIFICGSKLYGDSTYSRYRIRREPGLPFPVEKKPTLAQWMKDNHPDILHKYEVLIEMKL